MPKKTTKPAVVEPEPVIIKPDPIDELKQELETEAPPAPKPEKKALAYIAYAPFEQDGEQYKEGDTFSPPNGWAVDTGFDEFRGIQVKNKEDKEIGIAFNVPGEIINKKTGERLYRRQVIPVREA